MQRVATIKAVAGAPRRGCRRRGAWCRLPDRSSARAPIHGRERRCTCPPVAWWAAPRPLPTGIAARTPLLPSESCCPRCLACTARNPCGGWDAFPSTQPLDLAVKHECGATTTRRRTPPVIGPSSWLMSTDFLCASAARKPRSPFVPPDCVHSAPCLGAPYATLLPTRRLLRQRLPRAFRGHPLKRAVCAVRGGPTRALRWMHGEAVGARRPPSDRGGRTELERSVEGPRRRCAAAAHPPERRQPTGRRRRRASGGAALGVAHLAGVGGGRGRWRRACRSAHEAAGDGGPDGGPTRTLGGAARRAAATTTGDRVR